MNLTGRQNIVLLSNYDFLTVDKSARSSSFTTFVCCTEDSFAALFYDDMIMMLYLVRVTG